MGGTGLRDDAKLKNAELVARAYSLEEYFAEVLPTHTHFDSTDRKWSWSTPAGFWSIQHGRPDRGGDNSRQIHLAGPLGVQSTWPDDETGLGLTMAILRTLGAVDRDDEEPDESRRDLIERVVAECRRKYWQDGQTDAEFVAGVLAQLDIDGWLVEPHPAVTP